MSRLPMLWQLNRLDVRGDAYAALDQTEQARDAWQTVLELAQTQNQPLYGVQFKLDDLGVEEVTQ